MSKNALGETNKEVRQMWSMKGIKWISIWMKLIFSFKEFWPSDDDERLRKKRLPIR